MSKGELSSELGKFSSELGELSSDCWATCLRVRFL